MLKTNLSWRKRQILTTMVLVAVAWLAMAPPLAVRNGAYQIYRAVAWQKVRLETKGMSQIASGPIQVFYHDDDQRSAELVVALFEEYSQDVDQNYGYGSWQPIQVVIHPSRPSLATSMGWASGDSALGVYWGGSIKLLSPTVWLAGKTPEEIERIYRRNGPVIHEYTHLVIDQLAAGNIPRWLTEGLAQVEEQRLTGYLWLERGSALRKENLYPLKRMNGEFDRLPNQPLAYHQSYTLAKFLVDQVGQEKVNAFLRELGKGYTMNQALIKVAGYDLAVFEQNWRDWVLNDYAPGAS